MFEPPRHGSTEISAAGIAARLRQLRAANTELRLRPMNEILLLLDHVVSLWLAPDSTWRTEAEENLPDATGYSPEMIRYGLPLQLAPLHAENVREVLAREIGPRRGQGPALIAHIMSGNIPALSASSIVLSLAIGSCALVKAARGDRIFPRMFADSIAAVDAPLGACVDALYWPGGAQDIEDAVFRAADLVVAFGSDASIAAMQARCHARFIGHGHRVSFAVVTRDILERERTLAGLAEDVSLWDQRGCLSPQVCFVEGNYEHACAFAAGLAPHLDAMAVRLPPGNLGPEEQTAIRRFRDDAEWRALAGQRVSLLTPSSGLSWTIVVEAEPIFAPTPLSRSLRVLPVERLEMVSDLVAPARGLLEAAGVAAPAERRAALDAMLQRAGVHWITDIGQMQKPPLGWTQGGRPRVADWLG